MWNWTDLLFSFKGRASRTQYWVVSLLASPVIFVALYMNVKANGYDMQQPLWTGPGSWLFILLWPLLPVTIKRWHDRDKSGWWILINLVPLVGDIWSFIENGLLRGTAGENRFGPDPTAASAQRALP
jgi:uncharacterized membrane protein YhaH (DUF805 family)